MLLALGGVAGSAFAAESVAREDAEAARQAFERSSAEVASTLELATRHQDDLLVNASSYIVRNQLATQAQFRAWVASSHILDRYPDVLGVGFAVIVPASELPAFIARISADPPNPLAADGSFQIIPPGDRPLYCFVALGESRAPLAGAGTDFCADSGAEFVFTQDSGDSTYS
ncbi:MAG: CHASE domain-containing protein, partial [Aeromicrobium sp.]